MTKENGNMKKIFAAVAIMVVLFATLFVSTGLQKRTDVILVDYTVAEDESTISLKVQVASSMGYVRCFKDNGGGEKPHYLTFYNAFGFLNSPLATSHAFVLDIAPSDTEIYFNRPDGGHELVLVKDEEEGKWLRPEEIMPTQDAAMESVTYEQITAEEAKALMDSETNYIILDVRTEEEFNESHIEGAILIPDYEIEEKAEYVLKDKDQLILVYCRSGRRSKLAAEDLVKLGYTNVKEFGGIIEWPYEIVTE